MIQLLKSFYHYVINGFVGIVCKIWDKAAIYVKPELCREQMLIYQVK